MGTKPLLHIISHTDLDGVAAAALAWHANYGAERLLRVSLTGYGDVDNLILESLRANEEPLVLDLFCQWTQTVDEVDGVWEKERPPFLFDHHKSTFERYGNRKWAVIDTNWCGAMVYWKWLMEQEQKDEQRARIAAMKPLMDIANDRDLWLGQIPESRLWQGLVTMCGHWSILMRLVADPSPVLTPEEKACAEKFVARQEERFSKAKEKIVRTRDDLSFVFDGVLEFGDVSDFCGLVLDREPAPPLVVAVSSRRAGGDWAVSMRSRDGLAGRVMTLLKDGRKIRGGGHGDASALYFPRHYTEEQIRDSILAAIKAEKERAESPNVTLGDLFKELRA